MHPEKIPEMPFFPSLNSSSEFYKGDHVCAAEPPGLVQWWQYVRQNPLVQVWLRPLGSGGLEWGKGGLGALEQLL